MSEQKQERQAKREPSVEQRLADLELQLAQARAGIPLGTIPENAAGIGTEVAETWSQYDQELANMGEHPDQ
jgi:hypothetical protein